MKAVPSLNKLFGAAHVARYFDEVYFAPHRWNGVREVEMTHVDLS